MDYLTLRQCPNSDLSEERPLVPSDVPNDGVNKILVDLVEARYPVYFDHKLVGQICKFLTGISSDRRVLLVFDPHLESSYARQLRSSLIQSGFEVYDYGMEAGKVNKNIEEVLQIISLLEAQNFSRDSCLVALGGGVIGDLAGFAASCWYRGMNLIHIPSNLISMIDSSIGGKCAVNFNKTVNAIGSYHHPVANFLDLDLLLKLPEREFRSGMAEIVKSALICDESFFDYLWINKELINAREINAIRYIVERTIDIKVSHVLGDIREGGKRLLLNFGHTLGHAIEMATQGLEESFRHGEGVALGISAILSINSEYFGLDDAIATRSRVLLSSFGLPVKLNAKSYGFERNDLVELCTKLVSRDKKRKDGLLRLILLDSIGSAYVQTCSDRSIIRFGFESIIE